MCSSIPSARRGLNLDRSHSPVGLVAAQVIGSAAVVTATAEGLRHSERMAAETGVEEKAAATGGVRGAVCALTVVALGRDSAAKSSAADWEGAPIALEVVSGHLEHWVGSLEGVECSAVMVEWHRCCSCPPSLNPHRSIQCTRNLEIHRAPCSNHPRARSTSRLCLLGSGRQQKVRVRESPLAPQRNGKQYE